MKSTKLFFISTIALAFATLLFGSCRKTETPQIQYEATFYVGGDSPDIAYIYKNGEILYDLGANASVDGIALTSDGTVYAAGSTYKRAEDMLIPAIWKNGEAIDLSFISAKEGIFEDIVANGNNWASCAKLKNEDNQSYGCVVENGKIIYESESDVYFLCMAYGPSGDLYVVADDKEGIKLLRIAAEASHSLLSTELIASHVDGSSWIAKCIHVGLSDIAVGLDKFYTDSMSSDSYIWFNGGRGMQCLDRGSEINDITFFSGYLVAVGDKLTVTGSGENLSIKSTAVQWVNGLAEDFSYGCTGDSSVTMVKNWNNMFLFQCVWSESGVQLCANGGLYKEIINLPDGFYVDCWEVVVKQI